MPPDVQQSFIDQRGGIPGEVEEELEPVPEAPLGQSVSDPKAPISKKPEPEEKESSDEETQM
eukprot:5292645-Karenia_brevis.AAC.1